MECCSQEVSALLPRDEQSGLRALPGRHGHHGGGRPRVDPAGQRQHRVAANVPSHLRPAEAQVGAGGVRRAGAGSALRGLSSPGSGRCCGRSALDVGFVPLLSAKVAV